MRYILISFFIVLVALRSPFLITSCRCLLSQSSVTTSTILSFFLGPTRTRVRNVMRQSFQLTVHTTSPGAVQVPGGLEQNFTAATTYLDVYTYSSQYKYKYQFRSCGGNIPCESTTPNPKFRPCYTFMNPSNQYNICYYDDIQKVKN